jgi:hypothetical protein
LTTSFDIDPDDLKIKITPTPPMVFEGRAKPSAPGAPPPDPGLMLEKAQRDIDTATKTVGDAKAKHDDAVAICADAAKVYADAKASVLETERNHADGHVPFADVEVSRRAMDSAALKVRRTTELENRAADSFRHAEQAAQEAAQGLAVAERGVRHAETEKLQARFCDQMAQLHQMTDKMTELSGTDDFNLLRGGLLMRLRTHAQAHGYSFDTFKHIWLGGGR